jgi:CBS domain-containing protein
MRVKEIMSPTPTSVTPSVGAGAAWELMKADHIHHLVVLDGKRIAGRVLVRQRRSGVATL